MKKLFSRKCPKRVKGMTLIEVLIAMAIFGIAGTLMVKIGSAAKTQLLSSSRINNKTQAEAAIGNGERLTDLTAMSTATSVSTNETEITFNIGGYGSVTAKRYDTLAADKDAESKGINCKTGMNDVSSRLHMDDVSLQFYVVD